MDWQSRTINLTEDHHHHQPNPTPACEIGDLNGLELQYLFIWVDWDTVTLGLAAVTIQTQQWDKHKLFNKPTEGFSFHGFDF